MKDIKIEHKPHQGKVWVSTTLEFFLESVNLTREIILETEQSPYQHNPAGRIVNTPGLLFRLAEGVTCPKCRAKFQESTGALSRRGNKTQICSDCGTREALEDLQVAIK